MFELILPWFPFELRPNASSPGNWRKKSTAAKAYRARCGWIAKLNKPELPNGNIHLLITFCPPSKRAMDLDNCLAAIKSGIDGLADAWGINDKRFYPITIDWGEVIKDGCVKISIKS